MNHRIFAVTAIAGMVLAGAAACGSNEPSTQPSSSPGKEDASQLTANTYSAPATPGRESGSGGDTKRQALSGVPAAGPSTAGGGDYTLPDSAADFGRKIIVNANMTLNVKDVESAFAEAGRLACNAGGYVEKSGFTNPGGSEREKDNLRATITLRVPADQYEATLAALRGIDGAKVQSEGSKSNEVTEQYTDLQSRLRNLERTEGQYLKLLEQAKTIPEILQLNDRLDSVRGQIEQIQGRINVLDKLTELATIDLTLAPFPAKVTEDSGSRSLGEVFADAWQASLDKVRQVAEAGIYAGVAAVWLIIPAGFVLFGARRLLRRGHGSGAAA